MDSMAKFYLQTWWVWLLIVVAFIFMAIKIHGVFWLFVPGIIVYSFYFGWVRVTDESRQHD